MSGPLRTDPHTAPSLRGTQGDRGRDLTHAHDHRVLAAQLAGIASARLRAVYLAACRAEVVAPKPGNVSVVSPGHDMSATDFLRSARVSAPHLCPDSEGRLGDRVLGAVEATRASVGCNTNLGIVLLAAPLLMAARTAGDRGPLANRVASVLEGLDERDTTQVFAAIRLASPAGLGGSPRFDVRQPPPHTDLRAVMASAAGRDRIARQYATGFVDIFDDGRALASDWRARIANPNWQIVALYLGLLSRFPDTHIARKHGEPLATEVSRRARDLYRMLEHRGISPRLMQRLGDFDAALKARGINPGTTADLTVATLIVQSLEEPA